MKEEELGSKLILRVMPDRKVAPACDECSHVHKIDHATSYCQAFGGRDCVNLRAHFSEQYKAFACPGYKPKPPPGLMRRFWRWLW